MEVSEALLPLIYHKKEIMADCGGNGEFRGGHSLDVVFEVTSENPVTVSFLNERIKNPARGRHGGKSGAPGKLLINGKAPDHPKSQRILTKGDVVTMRAPGGGGWGETSKRDPKLIKDDLQEGFLTPEKAIEEYGIAEDEIRDLME
jgi:N-methylhydantoinase B